MLRAIHRDGKQPLYSWMGMPNDYDAGISMANGPEMLAFNRLASQYDTWTGPHEHARFAVRALRQRVREIWRQEGKTRVGSFSTSAYFAKQISEGLTNTATQDPAQLDEILEHGYRLSL